ncbi:MAG TPA: hypothetical protein VFN67_34705 [Polyangiales bacterium]|nr:hypothetical protein [Polyangiales bacterium]
MPHQEALTIIAKVAPEREAELADVMRVLAQNPAQNDVLSFSAWPGCHFGRVLHLPASTDPHGARIGPQLMLLSDCDGPAHTHLRQLVDVAGAGLDRLFGPCVDYPRQPAPESRLAFLKKRVQNVKAVYVHRQGRTVEQIRREAELRKALVAFVAAQRFQDLCALSIRDQIIAHARTTGPLRWALDAAPTLDTKYRLQNALDLLTVPLGLIAFGPVVIPAAVLLLLLVRLQEQRDATDPKPPSLDLVRALNELEDFAAHNGFTAGGYVKPGWVRRAAVSSLLPLIGWGSRHLFTQDSLAGVKSIHFARWVPLDEGRRVIFASNYDGSLESYNNDFIDLVAWGLNLIFSNGLGYPSTRWLIFGGARYEQDFKNFLRSRQIPTPVWYSAYPQLSARNVERNAKLRAGLRGRMTEQEAQAWLSLL